MHVCYLKPGGYSGYETRVIEEVRFLKRLGVRIIIACFIGRDQLFPIGRLWRFYRRLKRFTGAKVYIIPTSHYFDLSVPPDGVKSIVLPLVILSRLYNVDIMHGQALYSTIHVLRARNRTGTKVVFDVHGVSPEETEMSGGHISRIKRLTEWEKKALNTADLRIFVSNQMKDFFKGKYGLSDMPYVLIPNCVHNERFQMSEEIKLSKREQLGIKDKFVFLYLGTLSVWQWPEAMFSLFAQFYKRRPDSLFYLLLPYYEHEKAVSFLKKHNLPSKSYVVEEVPHSEGGSVVGIADAGLLLRESNPVNYVSSPTKFGEYLAAGVPVISTKGIGDTSDIIRNEKVGLTISPNDEGITSEDLECLLRFTEDVMKNRLKWSNQCINASKKFLQWSVYGKVIEKAYENLVQKKGFAIQTISPELEKDENLIHVTSVPRKPVHGENTKDNGNEIYKKKT